MVFFVFCCCLGKTFHAFFVTNPQVLSGGCARRTQQIPRSGAQGGLFGPLWLEDPVLWCFLRRPQVRSCVFVCVCIYVYVCTCFSSCFCLLAPMVWNVRVDMDMDVVWCSGSSACVCVFGTITAQRACFCVHDCACCQVSLVSTPHANPDVLKAKDPFDGRITPNCKAQSYLWEPGVSCFKRLGTAWTRWAAASGFKFSYNLPSESTLVRTHGRVTSCSSSLWWSYTWGRHIPILARDMHTP
jgi:hypothetical protein